MRQMNNVLIRNHLLGLVQRNILRKNFPISGTQKERVCWLTESLILRSYAARICGVFLNADSK